MRRTQSGIYLIEVLVALVLGSLLMLALLALYLATLRVTTASQSQLISDQIGESVFDYCRSLSLNPGSLTPGTAALEINTVSGVPPSSYQATALGVDQTNFTWQPISISGDFKGTAQVSVAQSADASYDTLTVTVTWSDLRSAQQHTSVYSDVIYVNGENSSGGN